MVKHKMFILAVLLLLAVPAISLAEDATLVAFPAGDIAAVMSGNKIFPVRMIGIIVDGTSVYREERLLNGTAKRLKDFLAKIAPRGSKVKLEFDSQQNDPAIQGYLAAYIWLPNGKMLNEEIIKAGLAMPANEGKYVERFVNAFNQVH
jgi:endonuclease YncB( thermonuclease family)